jgi:hypothetical protein
MKLLHRFDAIFAHIPERRLIYSLVALDMLISAGSVLLYKAAGDPFISGKTIGSYWLHTHYQRATLIWVITVLIITLLWVVLLLRHMFEQPLGCYLPYITMVLVAAIVICGTTFAGPVVSSFDVVHQETLRTTEHNYYLVKVIPTYCPTNSECSYEYALFKCDRYNIICSRVYATEKLYLAPINPYLEFDERTNQIRIVYFNQIIYEADD